MADVHNKATRSYNMQQIKSKNTRPEMLVRRFLHANGFRYRLHGGKPAAAKALAGRPDIVLPKYRTVIFVHACLPVGRVAFGMDILIANILLCRRLEPNGGPIT